ncbi:MAG: hypothetical protein IKY44_01000 [Clostridia bacterium]|nr:hypothetical protein [Clostridia bacterium]
MSNINERINENENVFAGIVGSFLFSLVGGVVWFLLWQADILAAISGIIGVVCAIKGYSIFAKKESIKGIVISVIISLLVMVLAWYFCLAYDVYNKYQNDFAQGYIDFTITFGAAFRNAYYFLEGSEGYYSGLAMGLVFCVIGGAGYASAAIKRVKAAKQAGEQPAPAPCDEVAYEASEEAPEQNQYNGEPEFRVGSTDEN